MTSQGGQSFVTNRKWKSPCLDKNLETNLLSCPVDSSQDKRKSRFALKKVALVENGLKSTKFEAISSNQSKDMHNYQLKLHKT